MGKQTCYWFGTFCPALIGRFPHRMGVRSGLSFGRNRSCLDCGIDEDATPYLPDGRSMHIRMIEQMIPGQPQLTWTPNGVVQQPSGFTLVRQPNGNYVYSAPDPNQGGHYHTHQVTHDDHGNWYWRT